MTISTFVTACRDHLASILQESGSVLYSAASTLAPGTYYILGLNPGGSSGPTIRECLDKLPQYNQNAYLDGDWSSDGKKYQPGEHPLQRHLKQLMQELDVDLRGVCASNLIFARSPNQNGADFQKNKCICWPVHKLILSIVKPSAIIAFGNGAISPYAFLTQNHFKTHGVWPTEATCPAEYGSWECKSFETEIDHLHLLVLGVPHLSRYTIENKPVVMNWIKERIEEYHHPSNRAR